MFQKSRTGGRVYTIHGTNGFLGVKKIRTNGRLRRLFGQHHKTSISPALGAESWPLLLAV
jgi:hypothetical protein